MSFGNEAMGRFTFVGTLFCLYIVACMVHAEDPYVFYEWRVTYGTISPLSIPQQVILINGQFPGPKINCTSNNNIVVNVFNELDEDFLLTWNGVQQRKNSWMDGTPGTMCPITPGTNFTYKFQVKDQIGSYYYFPTLGMQKAVGGIGPIDIHSRDLIPVPFDTPAAEFNVLMGDWFNAGHKTLKRILDSGRSFRGPDGIQINGRSLNVGEPSLPIFTMELGKTYRYRACNVGIRTSINFRIQGHPMKLVEVEGSHTVQSIYDSLDIHVGQCFSVLVTANQVPMDYYMVASSKFIWNPLQSVAVIGYAGAKVPASPFLPPAPPETMDWSVNQFRSLRWNLTASAARPNPQGSYHYGQINITRTIRITSSTTQVYGKIRFAMNGVSHIDPMTPVKLLEYFGLANKTFQYDVMKDQPTFPEPPVIVAPNVINAIFRNFVEIIFENTENTDQAYHLDGHSFFAVAIEAGTWSPEKRVNYNLVDAVSRNNIHVYANSWAAVMTTLDNAGMWNLRSELWERFYLGQQLYISLLSPERSIRDEYNMPEVSLQCGDVKGLPIPAPYG